MIEEDRLGRLRAFAHELAGMAQTGLQYAENEYDRDRYERVRRIGEELARLTLFQRAQVACALAGARDALFQ